MHYSISDSTDEKYMVNCSRWIAARIFEWVLVVAEVYEYPNLLKYGNSRIPTALGLYLEYLV